MALASTLTATVEGVSAHMVTVETNVGPGLPGMHIVGLGDAAVRESRDRIRTAIANSRLPWPRTKIMVSLSPAHLRKAGSHFDLPIALSVVGSLEPQLHPVLARTLIMGELALDGTLRRVEGVLPMLIHAEHARAESAGVDFNFVIVPRANAGEAALLQRANVLVGDSLTQVWHWMRGTLSLETAIDAAADMEPPAAASTLPDFADVAGQAAERAAFEVAAAGGHHMLMVGPPGSGKSMLAERLPSILPPMTIDEQIETTALHSAAGVSRGEIVGRRPFVAPHPSISRYELIGGGSGVPVPGAVSQAHNGVLFLDEASEISAQVLDSLRIPLEKRIVVHRRERREVVYPANFQLVLAANPCPCGKGIKTCRCKPMQRANHLANVSGPLRDRLDIYLRTTAQTAVLSPKGAEPSSAILARVMDARGRAVHRWGAAGSTAATNAAMDATVIRRHFPPDESASATLESMLKHGELTQRGVDRVLKLAWTMADLEQVAKPNIDHIFRAVELRQTAHGEEAA